MLAQRPLSPAGSALARRVLATGRDGAPGAGQDRALAGARAQALIAQGDPTGGAAILGARPGSSATRRFRRRRSRPPCWPATSTAPAPRRTG
jgi:hypothetical protein